MSRRTPDVIQNVSRRAVLLGLGGATLVLAMRLPAAAQAPAQQYGGEGMPHGLRDDPRLFVAIAPDGTVTVTCHRSDMGQGVRTSWAMVVADELDADWTRVRIAQAWADENRFGNQDTDGSRSMRQHFASLRRIGAAARQMLEAAAAAQWGVPASAVAAENHELVHRPSGRRIGYGAVAAAAAQSAVPPHDSLRLKEPQRFRYIGRDDVGLVDGFDITTGRARYGIDTRLDGMLTAVVARPPVYGGKVQRYDASAALRVPGVVKVVEIAPTPPPARFWPLGGIAVIARDTWSAIRGREALQITWDDGPNASYASDTYRATLEAAARQPGPVVRNNGDVDAGMARAVRRVANEYYIPHLAQAPMEPPAATARIVDGKCEVWACVQAPQATHDDIAQRLGLAPENVKVNVTLLGGGFGRKSKPDFATEAALLSQAMDGAPVKVTWTREDDLHNGYYHTVSVDRIEAGLDAENRPVAWLHRTVAPSIGSIFEAGAEHEAPFELGMGAVNMPFAIANVRVENPAAQAHARIGWYRSVSNIPHAFAIQSFVAELAAATRRDPKDTLLDLIGPPRRVAPAAMSDSWNYGEDPALYPLDTGRLARVIQTAADGAGWGKAMPQGHGLGIAGHYSFVSYIATVVEVAVGPRGQLAIPRVDIAIDCGPAVNPDRIRSQLEGAVIMGLGNAIGGEITFKDGKVEQSNFDGYEVMRMDASPREIHVHIVPASDWNAPLGGVGEPGVPPVAPALANAIFAATGKRIRSLPIRDQLAG